MYVSSAVNKDRLALVFNELLWFYKDTHISLRSQLRSDSRDVINRENTKARNLLIEVHLSDCRAIRGLCVIQQFILLCIINLCKGPSLSAYDMSLVLKLPLMSTQVTTDREPATALSSFPAPLPPCEHTHPIPCHDKECHSQRDCPLFPQECTSRRPSP